MSSYPFKCDLCGGVTDAPTYGDFNCQHCGQVYVYDECHRIELSEPQLKTLRESRWIPVSERLPEPNERVLVFCPLLEPHEVIGATSYPGSTWSVWITDDGQELGKTEPTHWMPLPGPPEVR